MISWRLCLLPVLLLAGNAWSVEDPPPAYKAIAIRHGVPPVVLYTPQLKRWVSEQKNVKLAWHHVPLDIHGVAALSEARLVQCAGYLGGPAVFWQAIDQVLLRTRGNGQGVAEELELPDVSAESLSSCARTKLDIHAVVDRQLVEAKRRGITATPTIEVTDSQTGHSVRLEGPVDSTALLSVIDALAAQRKEETR